MPDDAFYKSLPQKRMGSGCLLFNAKDEVLLVNPTYKESWEIPGGIVEENESPRSCCEREIREEIGLTVSVKRLLVVDYNSYPEEPHKTESLMFIFDGGVLSERELATTKLDENELSEWKFFAVDNLPDDMNSSLRKRIIQAVHQREHPSNVYLENQQTI